MSIIGRNSPPKLLTTISLRAKTHRRVLRYSLTFSRFLKRYWGRRGAPFGAAAGIAFFQFVKPDD
jgi:hypothetical protein